MTHPEDPNDPTIWFNRFGVALAAARVDEFASRDAYDSFVEQLAEADGPNDLDAADRARFIALEGRANAGGNPNVQYEARGDWAAEDALEDAEDQAAAQVKADDEGWVGL